jgi:hypothetical protein
MKLFRKTHWILDLFVIAVCYATSAAVAVAAGMMMEAPPGGIDVNVVNQTDSPVPVTGEVDARINNNPGTESFWARGFHRIETDTNGTKFAVTVTFTFTFLNDNSQADTVPLGKIAVVEYLTCRITQMEGTFNVNETFSLLTSSGGAIVSLLDLPWVETGSSIVRAHFNSPVRLYAGATDFIRVQLGVTGPSDTSCNVTGYLIDKPL